MTADYTVVELEEIEQEQFPESGNRHRKLTEPLGCSEMRLNTVTLAPGETTAPHTHEQQEEVYLALDGGVVEIDGNRHEVSSGGVVRIGPDAIRSVRNDTDTEEQTWIMCGAPPLGTVDDFGQYRMPDDAN
ncbi:cupin domain-containing protein [Halobellus sp. H-GB7]|uniref:cupin domain-containing protein n=1 Tax=Halobellus sp. H-GB7 TaxID=3069756 RepID=UPI0027B4C62F|nr:cupin domain-containing protein [Halobellus sp. H-GB7]MDQ2055987.1 cupin domain-containing protein [Halobellus sp. H-GB7]